MGQAGVVNLGSQMPGVGRLTFVDEAELEGGSPLPFLWSEKLDSQTIGALCWLLNVCEDRSNREEEKQKTTTKARAE